MSTIINKGTGVTRPLDTVRIYANRLGAIRRYSLAGISCDPTAAGWEPVPDTQGVFVMPGDTTHRLILKNDEAWLTQQRRDSLRPAALDALATSTLRGARCLGAPMPMPLALRAPMIGPADYDGERPEEGSRRAAVSVKAVSFMGVRAVIRLDGNTTRADIGWFVDFEIVPTHTREGEPRRAFYAGDAARIPHFADAEEVGVFLSRCLDELAEFILELTPRGFSPYPTCALKLPWIADGVHMPGIDDVAWIARIPTWSGPKKVLLAQGYNRVSELRKPEDVARVVKRAQAATNWKQVC